jgi:hypothetical protein
VFISQGRLSIVFSMPSKELSFFAQMSGTEARQETHAKLV